MTLKRFLRAFGATAVLLTLLPFIAIDYWWIRIFDFPHFQLTLLTLIALLTYFIRFDIRSKKDYLFVSVLSTCFVFQFLKIVAYTPLAPYEVLESTIDDPEKTLSIYTANVLQKNDNNEPLISQINSYDADLILLVETDQKWQKALFPAIRESYPYKVEYPLDNTYGILLYSKLPLINPRVKFIVDDSIPSIHTLMQLPTGDTIQFYAIHPTPPMPQHNPSSTDRDAEMMKIALASMESKYPVIVAGDFNDVAWSETTRNFQKISGLLDIRKGRGFFNTYHAKLVLFRWPLDHIFISEHFRVMAAERCASIDSDHFPIYAKVSFEPEKANLQKALPPDKEVLATARAQIQDEKEQEQK